MEGFLSKWKQGAFPFVLSSAVCLWLCQRGTIAVLISHTEQDAIPRDGSQGFPFRQEGRSLPCPVQAAHGSCTAASPCSGGNVHRPETSTNHPKHGKQVVSVLPPMQTGLSPLDLCCLTLFPAPIPSPFSCAFAASAGNPVTRRLLQSTSKVHPAAVLFHAKHDCVIRACATGHAHLKSCNS